MPAPATARAMGLAHPGQRAAAGAGGSQLAVQQEGAQPQGLPGAGAVAAVVALGALEAGAADFALRVVEEHFGPARVSPAGGVGAGDDPLAELGDELPARGDGGAALLAQPRAELGSRSANFSTRANWRPRGSSLSRSAAARLAPPEQKE